MKSIKKIIMYVVLLSMFLCITVNAFEVRNITIKPGISFSGTTANCTVLIAANSTSDEIKTKITFYEGSKCIATWNVTGKGYLNFSKSQSVSKGKTYTLNVDATINGEKKSTKSYTGTCK